METYGHNSSNSSSHISVGRRTYNSSINSYAARLERKTSFMKPKKHRAKGFISSRPWHAVFGFLNPLLVGVIQVKCQGAKFSPFHSHPAEMRTFLLATLVYCLAIFANKKCRRRRTTYALISGHVILISGSLASVSLYSVFLPMQWGRLAFISWIIFSVLVFRQFIIYWPFQWTLEAVSKLLWNIRKRFSINGEINLDNKGPQSVLELV